MLTISFRRKTLFLLLALLLATPWAVSSAPIPQAEQPRAAMTAETTALDLAGRIWSFLKSTSNKIGCTADPNGICAPVPGQNPPTQSNKIGCRVDPDGLCLP